MDRDTGRQESAELRKDMMRLRNELEGEMLKDEPSEKAVLDLTRTKNQNTWDSQTTKVFGNDRSRS